METRKQQQSCRNVEGFAGVVPILSQVWIDILTLLFQEGGMFGPPQRRYKLNSLGVGNACLLLSIPKSRKIESSPHIQA